MVKSSHDFDSAMLKSELKGKTLLVYWYLLEQPTHVVGVQEVQRALGFSSPSIGAHHLDKLEDLGLVQKRETGEYVLEREVKVGILKLFAYMGRFIVPRCLFYSILFSTMLATYSAVCVVGQVSPSFCALVFGSVGSILFWLETVMLWTAKPL